MMSVYDLINYLQEQVDHGRGDSPVEVCDSRDNPLTEAVCITGAVFIEVKDGDSIVVLQTG